MSELLEIDMENDPSFLVEKAIEEPAKERPQEEINPCLSEEEIRETCELFAASLIERVPGIEPLLFTNGMNMKDISCFLTDNAVRGSLDGLS